MMLAEDDISTGWRARGQHNWRAIVRRRREGVGGWSLKRTFWNAKQKKACPSALFAALVVNCKNKEDNNLNKAKTKKLKGEKDEQREVDTIYNVAARSPSSKIHGARQRDKFPQRDGALSASIGSQEANIIK